MGFAFLPDPADADPDDYEEESYDVLNRYVTDGCLVGLHVKIGQLLDAWGAPEVPPDRHAAALYALSASPEHRGALAKFMPGGTTSPPDENELFESGTGLMIFNPDNPTTAYRQRTPLRELRTYLPGQRTYRKRSENW